MGNSVLKNPWVHAGLFVVACAALGMLCYMLSPVLVPLMFALLVAYILNPVVNVLHRRGLSRGTAVAGMAILSIVLLLFIPLWLVPQVISEADRLMTASANDGEQANRMLSWADAALSRLPLDRIVRGLGWATPEQQDIDARAILAQNIGAYVKANAGQLLRTYVPSTLAGVGNLAQFLAVLGRGIVSFAVFLASFALFAFVSGYLLRDFDKLVDAAKGLIPPRHHDRTFDIIARVDRQLRCFLRGQFAVCVCLGGMYAVGLTISGVPFGILIAAFGAVGSFVPYLGLMLTIGPALILCFLQHGLDWHIIGVIVTFVVAQMVEGTILTPKIVGEQVGLNPVWVILAIMVFGSLLGFVGLLLAVPMAACLKVLVEEAVVYYRRSALFEGDGPDAGVG